MKTGVKRIKGDGGLLNGVVLGYKIPLEERTHPINLKIKKLKVKHKDELIFDFDAKKVWRYRQKRREAEVMMSRLGMSKNQQERVQYLIKQFPNTQKLCAKCDCETVILALCMYIKFCDYKKEKLEKYNLCKEYGLTENIYSTIITKLANHFQTLQPLSHGCHV
jgi:ligand-binding sensor protein